MATKQNQISRSIRQIDMKVCHLSSLLAGIKEGWNIMKKNGHLKERNHFDGKDMALLVVMIIIIYVVFSFLSDYKAYENSGKAQDQNNTIVMESSQAEE